MSVSKDQILEAISAMTVLELSQLIKDMEEKFGVSAAAAVAVAAPAAGGAAAPAAEEKTARALRHALPLSFMQHVRDTRKTRHQTAFSLSSEAITEDRRRSSESPASGVQPALSLSAQGLVEANRR